MRVADLIAKYDLPPELSDLYARRRIETLNNTQVAALDAGLLAGRNLLVSAPTSSGKSLVGEILTVSHAGNGLTIYLVSHKALARQVQQAFEQYSADAAPLLRAGLLTGDADQVTGRWDSFDVVVATYEKFYASVLADPGCLHHVRAVVADEVQIVGEPGRGAPIELLLTQLARAKPRVQVLALSATVSNVAALAAWIDATVVQTTERVPPLDHEIWVPGQRLVVRDGRLVSISQAVDPRNVRTLVSSVIDARQGPIAIMATMRKDVFPLAKKIADLFPVKEDFPTQIVEDFLLTGNDAPQVSELAALLRRGIGTHTADLSVQQRAVVEYAYLKGLLSVVVATPTIVAGINLPIRTVIYPSMERWAGKTELISLAEYTNGSGRAGRLGYHDRGTSIIVAESVLQARALYRKYITAQLEPVTSQLGDRSPAYVLLHLLASAGSTGATLGELVTLGGTSFWGLEGRDSGERAARIRGLLEAGLADESLKRCVERHGDRLFATDLGRVVATTSLDPAACAEAHEALLRFEEQIAVGDDHDTAARTLLAGLCVATSMNGHLAPVGKNRRPLVANLRDNLGPILRAPFRMNKSEPISGASTPYDRRAHGAAAPQRRSLGADRAAVAAAAQAQVPVSRSKARGRTPSPHGHPLRAEDGHPVGGPSSGDGVRIGDHVLAPPAGLAGSQSVGAAPSRAPREVARRGQDRLVEGPR
jgi:helicase